MSQARKHSNLAARAGRWSASHWKTATFGWLALHRAGFHDHAGETVLVQSRTQATADSSVRREIRKIVARLETLPEIQSLRSPLSAGDKGQISKDGRSALIDFDIKGNPDAATDRVQPVLNAVAALQRGAPDFTVAEFGDASANLQLNKSVNDG